jgi:dihydrofolate reductase
MRASVFVGASVDGFIARQNGALDWLPTDGESHGYDEFIATVDTIVIGRKTFETVLAFEAWPYGGKRVVVLSSEPVDLSAAVARGGNVEQMGGPPAEILSNLSARGAQHLYVDGGITIQRFLRAGAHRPSRHHSCACAHRGRDSAFREPATGHPPSSYCDAVLSERARSERI